MVLQILFASILMLNFCHSETVLPPTENSHTEASNIETTKISYNNSPGNQKVNEPLQNAPHNENTRQQEASDNSWVYQPFIEYTNVSPHSKSITQIAFGKNAVEALQKSKESQSESNQNILYVQSKVAKPVDNQLPVQSEVNNNFYYIPSVGGNSQDGYSQLPSAPGPVLYYTHLSQGSQQLHPDPQNENVVYITPQPQDNYSPSQQNYYLVTHIHPTEPQTANQPELIEYQSLKHQPQPDGNKKLKNIVVDNMMPDKKDEDKSRASEKKQKDKKEDGKEDKVLVESNTAKAIIEEYERHYIKRRKNVDVKVDGETGTSDFASTTPSPYLSGTTPVTITKPVPLSRQPIVVADLDENHLEFDDNTYSTTQSTIKTVKTSSSLYHATQPLIVTSRPLDTFLAPITAGVQLQPVESSKPKDSVVVEIQKSVPYYLGKFEFVQNDNNPTKNEEIKQNVDLGANLLKYSIERLPNPQALISEYKNSETGPVLNQLSYTTTVNHGQDQEQEPGQFDYNVQNAPYQPVLAPAPPQVEVAKLEKIPVEPDLHQPVDLLQYPLQQAHHQSPQIQIRQVLVQQPHFVSVPIKSVVDYVQKPLQYQHIPPLAQQQPHHNQQPILLQPFPHVTKLIPQFVPLKHHQDVQKVPMKSYSYASSYQPTHYNHNHHHNPHNYQISHSGFKKQKSIPNYPHLHLGNNFFQTVKFNDYIGMKPPKIQTQHQLPTQQVGPVASATTQQTTSNPPLSGPHFKGSQHLQTVHEYLPTTQLTDQQVRKYRNPRHSFDSSIRLEYGFMPPLIPSIEIDEFGKPIEKSES